MVPQNGFVALKTFGPFHAGGVDASGTFQNVPASPGQQFEGSVSANAPSGDSILGKNNYTNITLSFVDTLGNVIGSVNYSPGTNEQNTPIFDGRDTNMPQDKWVQYTVNAVAPAGTVAVRESLFFIQLNNQGGAVWFDNASLNLITANVVALAGDYNSDGRVDAADYVAWRKNNGTNNAAAERQRPGYADHLGPLRFVAHQLRQSAGQRIRAAVLRAARRCQSRRHLCSFA